MNVYRLNWNCSTAFKVEKIFRGQISRKLPRDIQRVAARKLEHINAATVLDSPGNRLEALGRFFDMEAQFWMNLQTRYDLETILEILAGRLDAEVHPV